jgi:hypothetical protein
MILYKYNMSEIDDLVDTFDNLNINITLIRAYVGYNNKYHDNFHNFISNNCDYNFEILLEINFLFSNYSTEVKQDLLNYNIYNINERSAEFLICILAYIDNYFDSENYYNIYMEAISNL